MILNSTASGSVGIYLNVVVFQVVMGWNWRAFIPREERYDIDGREVLIINKTTTDFSQLRDVILLVCKTEPMAQHFPKITFVIKPDLSNSQVNPSKLAVGLSVIEIGGKTVDQNISSFKQKWTGVITHELTHLYHNYRSGEIIAFRKNAHRLIIALDSKITSIEFSNLTSMRGILFLFSRYLFIEGVAQYNQILSHGKIFFSQVIFEQQYRLVYEQVNNKSVLFLRTLEVLKKRNLVLS